MILYSDVNKFFTFHIIFPYSFFCDHSIKEPVVSLINKQCITNSFWISSALILIFLRVLVIMLCSGKQNITGQVVMDITDP